MTLSAESSIAAPEAHRAESREGLTSPSFFGLLVTQFLGATNDNMFRWLVIGIGKDYVPADYAAVILSAGLACFVLPYILLAAPAGYLADRFSKRKVIVGCKVAEVVIMSLGVAAIYSQSVMALFIVVALMGSQSALFGPSKLGCIPEILRPRHISAANGLVGLTTVAATVIGAAAGNILYDASGRFGLEFGRLWLSGACLVGVAAVGWLASLAIRPLAPANPEMRFPYHAARQTWRDLATLAKSVPMLRVALGIAFFWSLGSLAQMNIDQFCFEGHLTQQKQIVPLLLSLVAGVGLGSVLAGAWSGGRVELGILPLGAGAIAVSSMMLYTSPADLSAAETLWTEAYVRAAAWLFAMGLGAGLFDVPLAAYMQHRSPPAQRGAVLAASNFITFFFILLAAGLYFVLRAPLLEGGRPLFTARQIFLLAGIATIPVFVYIVWLLPQATIRFVVWLASHTVYRVRVYGHDNLPEQGGALLVANHISWLDGVFLLMASSRNVRMLAYAGYVDRWWVRWLARTMGVIPISPGRKSVADSIRAARNALRAGELVCIFPEGAISRTGQLQAFKPGMLSIVKGTGAPVVPVYLDELWGSIFSFRGRRFFWKWPRHWPYPVSILFGKPLDRVTDVNQARAAVMELGVEVMEHRKTRNMILPRLFLRMCRRNMFRPKLADSTGAELNGASTLMRTLILRRLLERKVLDADEKYVGLLLPPSVPAVLANAALPLSGRIAVNLNYTVSTPVMASCIRQAGIRRVLTSRRVMEKLNLEIDAEVVYLEDLRDRITWADKLLAALTTWCMPVRLLEWHLGLLKIDLDDPLTVIFTSGSTGEPKGVVLTHHNVGSNIDAMDQMFNLLSTDVLAGALPFFHSFGYTTTLWTALTLAPKGVYHYSPLEARQFGSLAGKHRATILISTPTFLRSYLRRCQPEDFAALDVVLAGAERLPPELCDAFEAKFGVRPVEGYGATELSPLVAVNVPPSRAATAGQLTWKEGTVGRPIPGVRAKIVDPESGEELPVDQPGMLWIRGPNVMAGYLNRPDLTEKVIHDGWYETGDVATFDGDGFIRITGRQSRFSKIGGEMVPHLRVEESLQRLLPGSEEELKFVVTGVRDERKGERLVVLHTQLDKSPAELCKGLAAEGLPNLWIPSADCFCAVAEIPVLGTGKLDLKAVQELAEERFAQQPEDV